MANKRQKKAKPNDRLNYGDVSRELKAGGPARLYLLYGQEDYLREAFLGEIKAAASRTGATTSATTGSTARARPCASSRTP